MTKEQDEFLGRVVIFCLIVGGLYACSGPDDVEKAIGVSQQVACKYDEFNYSDARRARDDEHRADLAANRSAEFKRETGQDWQTFWGNWNSYVVENSNPC